MIANLKPYPVMKDSGVLGLGEVPQHWEVLPLGRIGRLLKGNGGTKADDVSDGVPCIRYGDLYTKHEFFIQASRSFVTPERSADYTQIRFGDVLFAASGETIDEIGKSAVNLVEAQACCGGDIIVLRPSRELIPSFLGYASDCPHAVSQKARMGRGITVMHIYGGHLKYLRIPLPFLSEQVAVVRLLDYVDGRLRRYIRAKEKLSQLLEEQKRAVIHHAVTRGLDPGVRFKPSDIEWLGDVPEHWEVRRLKFLAHIKTGGRDTVDRRDDGSYPFFVRSQTVERIDSYSFDGEAVLTAGDGAGVAKVFHYFDGKFDYHQRVYRFSGFRHILGKFFFYYLSCTLRYEAFRETAKSTVDSLRLPMLKNFPVPLPPPNEQLQIVKAVERETAASERSLTAVRREIELLREDPTRLIADVVTGKLDVRVAAAQLPEAAEDPEPPSEASNPAYGDEGPSAATDGIPGGAKS